MLVYVWESSTPADCGWGSMGMIVLCSEKCRETAGKMGWVLSESWYLQPLKGWEKGWSRTSWYIQQWRWIISRGIKMGWVMSGKTEISGSNQFFSCCSMRIWRSRLMGHYQFQILRFCKVANEIASFFPRGINRTGHGPIDPILDFCTRCCVLDIQHQKNNEMLVSSK